MLGCRGERIWSGLSLVGCDCFGDVVWLSSVVAEAVAIRDVLHAALKGNIRVRSKDETEEANQSGLC